MDLANLFDTISSLVITFYAFGCLNEFYWMTLWVITSSIGQLLSSYYNYLKNDIYRATKFGFHSLFWQIQAWEQFVLTVIIRSENVDETRQRMIGELIFCVIACILVLTSLSMSLLELIQNVFFALLTIATIHQLSDEKNEEAYFFFGIICLLYALISLYAICASLVNAYNEDLIPVGDQIISKVQEMLRPFQNHLIQFIQTNGFSEITSFHILDNLLYVCNGLAALSAIQGALTDSIKHSVKIPSVMTPGAMFQLYVCSIQANKGRRFSTFLPCYYAAIWAAWTWLQFSASIRDSGNTKSITLGILIFLIINIFFIIIDADVNIVLFILTLFMEILSVSYFLITWKPLPLPLDVAVLAMFCAVSIYGTVASLTIFMFKTDFISLGHLGFGKPRKALRYLSTSSISSEHSFPESSGTQIIHQSRSIQTLLKLFKDNDLCAIHIETLNALISASTENFGHRRIQSKNPSNEGTPLLLKSHSESKPQFQNESKPPSRHSLQQKKDVQRTVKIFDNDVRSVVSTDTASETRSNSHKKKEEKNMN